MNISSTILKQENRKNVYKEIYNKKAVSKNIILRDLNLSLPTITQNLEEFEQSGFIVKEGQYASTRGRPATIYKCCDNARIAVGVDLHPNNIEIAAINLYGEIVSEDSTNITFTYSDSYFQAFGSFVNAFVSKLCDNPREKILGLGVGLPGIIGADGNEMLYSEVLRTSEFTLLDLTQYIKDVPCRFYHNAEAGAFAEIWHGKLTESALVLTLDNCLCNALILDGRVYHGKLSSGTLEHMTLHPNGRQCYCGKKGCVDSYCSASSLRKMMKQTSLDEFFIDLRSGDSESVQIWDNYLSELALAIDNFRMIIASDVILSGLLQKYITKEDLSILKSKVMEITTFKNLDFNISIGNCGRKAIVIGAALPLIHQFLEEF